MRAEHVSKEPTALTLVDAHAAQQPGQAAILFGDEVLAYGKLVDGSKQLARVLMTRGVGPGKRVCMLAANCPAYYVAYFAVLRCGAAFFPINSDLTNEEIAYILARSEPVLTIVDASIEPRAKAICSEEKLSIPVVSLRTLEHELAALDQDIAPTAFPVRRPTDIALVIHTSGTTARPKGVVATDRMEVRSALALRDRWRIRPGDISVCALPLSYTFGLFSASFVALTSGATVLLFPKFHPVRVLEGIVRHGATYMVGVPTMYIMMLEHVSQTGKHYDLGSMRMMAASGAPIAPRVKEEFQRVLGVVLRDYYALSECTPIFSFDLSTDRPPPPVGSVGTLVPGADVELLDDSGQAVAPGETGALRVRSERLMPGYYLDPARTSSAFEGEWFKTGDLAYRDQDGHYFIVGRDRDQVISGGHKIASTEVENLIARYPGVAQVAVVGAPHPTLGEIVKAVVVPQDRQTVSAEEILAFCAAHLAGYKVPRSVEFREALPVSPAGKVLKRELV